MPIPRDEVSAIAHMNHPIACPFAVAHVDRLLRALDLAVQARVLDVGCGRGEWIARLLERYPDVQVTGVDASQTAIELARQRLVGRPVTLAVEDARSFLQATSGQFAAVLCNGSTHALGGFDAALLGLRSAIEPGGLLLIADGYWQRAPSEAALAALGAQPGDFSSLEETRARAERAGYAVLQVSASDAQEWDDYEHTWCDTLEHHVASHPDLPSDAADQLLSTARAHREAYFNGYRGTLGFAAFVLKQK